MRKQQRPRRINSGGDVESILERVVSDLLARDLSRKSGKRIEPEEITPEFIQRWREEHLYPGAPVKITTKYGGYNGKGLRVLTGNEIASQRERATKFLLRFS